MLLNIEILRKNGENSDESTLLWNKPKSKDGFIPYDKLQNKLYDILFADISYEITIDMRQRYIIGYVDIKKVEQFETICNFIIFLSNQKVIIKKEIIEVMYVLYKNNNFLAETERTLAIIGTNQEIKDETLDQDTTSIKHLYHIKSYESSHEEKTKSLKHLGKLIGEEKFRADPQLVGALEIGAKNRLNDMVIRTKCLELLNKCLKNDFKRTVKCLELTDISQLVYEKKLSHKIIQLFKLIPKWNTKTFKRTLSVQDLIHNLVYSNTNIDEVIKMIKNYKKGGYELSEICKNLVYVYRKELKHVTLKDIMKYGDVAELLLRDNIILSKDAFEFLANSIENEEYQGYIMTFGKKLISQNYYLHDLSNKFLYLFGCKENLGKFQL